MRFVPLALALVLLAAPAQARMQFSLPVDCTPGKDCFVQNYVDDDKAKGAFHDYTCGSLTYDGHTGTDIRVQNVAELDGEGVNVLAAAGGTVIGTQNEIAIREGDVPLIQLIKLGMMRYACGAGLRIDHGGGWNSFYCHMKDGSFTVKAGDKVKAGQVIGKMGMSGKSEFPHLHFGVKHYEVVIDPFVGHNTAYHCEPERRYSLWTPETEKLLSYHPTGTLGTGFSAGAPDVTHIRLYGGKPLHNLSQVLPMGIWADVYGMHKGDAVQMRLTAPNGQEIASKVMVQDMDAAIQLLTLTTEKPQAAWAQGAYRAELRITRGDTVALETSWKTELQ